MIATLADLPSRHVDPRKRRQETMALIHVGMIGAQRVSLAYLARARGSAGSRGPRPAAGCGDSSSTSACRRTARRRWSRSSPAGVTRARTGCRWQAVSAERPERKGRAAAPAGDGPHQPEGGKRPVNLPVVAIRTRHSQVPLIWTVPGHAGSSCSEKRIALMARYLALFGAGSVGMLVAGHEVVGANWLNGLDRNDIPFTPLWPATA